MSNIPPLNRTKDNASLIKKETCNPIKDIPVGAAIIKAFGEIQDHLELLPFDHEIKKEVASLIPPYDFLSLTFDEKKPEEILNELLDLKRILKDPKTCIKSDFFKKLNLQF